MEIAHHSVNEALWATVREASQGTHHSPAVCVSALDPCPQEAGLWVACAFSCALM